MTTPLKGACIIGQSGGPTAVINASAYGVIETALKSPNITTVYGAAPRHQGRSERPALSSWTRRIPRSLERLLYTPSSALGSCRYKIAGARTWTTPTTSGFWRFSRNTTSATSSITAATTPWTPATRSAATWQKVGYECTRYGRAQDHRQRPLSAPTTAPASPRAAKYIATILHGGLSATPTSMTPA